MTGYWTGFIDGAGINLVECKCQDPEVNNATYSTFGYSAAITPPEPWLSDPLYSFDYSDSLIEVYVNGVFHHSNYGIDSPDTTYYTCCDDDDPQKTLEVFITPIITYWDYTQDPWASCVCTYPRRSMGTMTLYKASCPGCGM